MANPPSPEQARDVDHYLEARFLAADPALEATLADAQAAGFPMIQVSALQGKMLQLLARSIGATAILEIGTLAGYSAIWLARALPTGGRLVTLELDPAHAALARKSLARAGVADRAEVKEGPARETLRDLKGPFDLVFIDADKAGYPDYLRLSLPLTRPGGLIVADNAIRKGAVLEEASTDPNVVGTRRFLDLLAAEPRVEATVIQTVGAKGYDGFALARVR